MDFALWYIIGAVALYFAADWLLNQIEISRGKRFENRSLIFFAMLFSMALIYMFVVNPQPS